jgi:hypothetical protein
VTTNNALQESGNAPASSLAGVINSKTGLLRLTFGNEDRKEKRRAYGAVLQDSQIAGGYSMTQTHGGAFELRSALFE